MTYRLLIDLEIVVWMQSLPAGSRRRLLAWFEALERNPRGCSDYRDADTCGRAVEISIREGFAIYYWIDEADRHVKILSLHEADGR